MACGVFGNAEIARSDDRSKSSAAFATPDPCQRLTVFMPFSRLGKTTSAVARNGLQAVADYADGMWTVVFSRPLAAAGDYQVNLAQDASFSLALWRGDGEQRDGLKYVTMGWTTLSGPTQE